MSVFDTDTAQQFLGFGDRLAEIRVLVGTVLGVAGSLATPDSFITTVDVPYATLAVYIVVAGLAGLLAAVLPARRAGRMNILEAIAHE